MLGSLAARNDVIQQISHSLQIAVKEPAHSLCAGSFAFWLGFLVSGNLVEDALPGRMDVSRVRRMEERIKHETNCKRKENFFAFDAFFFSN